MNNANQPITDVPTPGSGTVATRVDSARAPLSRGEVAFLYSFIRGSIMDVDVRWRLRHAWGLCPRHGAAWFCIEAAFRRRYLHGLAVLYADLMGRASSAFAISRALRETRLRHRLKARGPCLLCDLNVGPCSDGFIGDERLARGRSMENAFAFLDETRPFWSETVCGRCAGTAAMARCRVHLLQELADGSIESVDAQARLVEIIAQRVLIYDNSFQWECHGTDTPRDRSGLVSAIGWCGGWGALLDPPFGSS